MGLILLEALAAGILLIVIVWWTMFSGRKGGELHEDDDTPAGSDTRDENAGPAKAPSDPPPKP